MLSDGMAVITGFVANTDNENAENVRIEKRIFFIVL
jgi:hypothetical protein